MSSRERSASRSPTDTQRTSPELRRDELLTADFGQFTSIDWQHHLLRKRRQQSRALGSLSALHNVQSWVAVLSVGVIIGLLAGWLIIVLDWASDLKYEVSCNDWRSWRYMLFGARDVGFADFILYLLFSTSFAAIAGLFTAQLSSKFGPSSGIPEVKTILGGFVMNEFLSLQTALAKSLALVFSVGSGMSIGNKAPLVHIASCLGDAVANCFKQYRENEVAKRHLLSCASAAGIAVAFGSPIGGVLFSLEEISTYSPIPVIYRSFFCALVATLTLQILDPFKTGYVVLFKVTYTRGWFLFELLPFLLLACVGGLLGAYFNKFNIKIQYLRRSSSWCRRLPVLELATLACFTCLFGYWNRFARADMTTLLAGLFKECEESSYHGLCDDNHRLSVTLLLLYTGMFRYCTAVITYGARAPSGVFIPSLVVGACFGRVVGMGMSALQVAHPTWRIFASCQLHDKGQTCISPGSYALLGAAAVMTGVTRMTISIAVIMLELTGALDFVLPVMISVLMAKLVADRIEPSSLADLYIILDEYPFLNDKEEFQITGTAEDVMTSINQIVALQNNMTVAEIKQLINNTDFNTFPIVNNLQDLGVEGYVTKADLKHAFAYEQRALPTTRVILCIPESDEISNGAPVVSRNNNQSLGLFPRSLEDLETITIPGYTAPITLDLRHCAEQTPLCVHPLSSSATVFDMFVKLGVRSLIVKRFGRLVGIITKKDIIRYYHQHRYEYHHPSLHLLPLDSHPSTGLIQRLVRHPHWRQPTWPSRSRLNTVQETDSLAELSPNSVEQDEVRLFDTQEPQLTPSMTKDFQNTVMMEPIQRDHI